MEKIPQDSIIGVTVVLLSCSYKNKEFARVGYYVNNDYGDPELRENPPADLDLTKVSCVELLYLGLVGALVSLSDRDALCEVSLRAL